MPDADADADRYAQRPAHAGRACRPRQNFFGRSTPTSAVNTVIA